MSKPDGWEDPEGLEMKELAQIEDRKAAARGASRSTVGSGLTWLLIAGSLLAVCVVLWMTLR
ncbi:hypothetical protein GCM10011390_39470 [Aureimonas endophytica]|uniref:Uncharacterized protein n=1 Tax=Aureimonas endophytica TaxID=2027858 RepID=A0A917E9L4_9HYPH|nr:hypothetical protein GCM10011390_39470 [Aureimonas endophytica]